MSISYHTYMIDICNICIYPLSFIINMVKCQWKEHDPGRDISSLHDPVPVAGQQVIPENELWQIIWMFTHTVISQFNWHPWTMLFRKMNWENCHINRCQSERTKIKLIKSEMFQIKEWVHLASCVSIAAQ